MDLTDDYGVPDDPEAYTGPEYSSTDGKLWIFPVFAFRVQPTITT